MITLPATETSTKQRIVIAGGGFGGIAAALTLARMKLPVVKIVLISDKPHLEYHAALYRVVTASSPLEVCIPLRDIFEGKAVEIVSDVVADISLTERTLTGASGSRYRFDFLVLAPGAETTYFNIPGLKERSFGFRTITEALRLKRHLHEVFTECENGTADEKICAAHIVIVGGGANGVELAGELAVYARTLARKHNLDPSLATVNLIEAAPRLLPALPEDFSARVTDRLRHLGVNIFLNRAIVKEETEEVFLRDMQIRTKTVIWTAGVTPNALVKNTRGLSLDKKGRVLVDEYLRPKGFPEVFIVGDAASTPYSGMAQTAVRDGRHAAATIARIIRDETLIPYLSAKPKYAIPAGPGWAAILMGNLRVYGRLGWRLRRIADFRYFLSILPLRKALLAFRSGKTLCESCAICLPEERGGT